jgi:hypothetical protein
MRITAKDAGLYTLREVTSAELKTIQKALFRRYAKLPEPDGVTVRLLDVIETALDVPVPD